ncbi:MAG TPA: hypothetical protein VFY14_06740 [Streptomyces sp.]|nr:hypothetical protein [Streptomyces sp.]
MGLISGAKRLVIDAWGWLNYKPIYSDELRGMPNRRVFPEAAASWVPAADERRLAAYKLLAAYDNNQVGEFAAVTGGMTERDRREFGDPSQFIDTLVSHVLGQEQYIVVPGAEHDGDTTPDPAAAQAERVQQLLRDWAEDELLPMRMQQTERKAVSLGDGVYRLAWDPGKKRVTVRSHDPGFYFPVVGEDADSGEYPTRVHFAWELPEDPARGLKARLRRITYELDWIRPATASGVDRRGRPVRAPLPAPDPVEGEEAPPPILTPGDLADPATGAISRQYPWNDEPSFVTCYLTDATWELGDLKGPHLDVDNLPLESAVFATRGDGEVLDRLDLLIDFVPVVHVPNTVPPAEEHWGQSSLAKILQVLDELAGTDTDSSKASATTGSPMVTLSGDYIGNPQQALEVGPGVAHKLGPGGRMDVLNTAPQLAELRNKTAELKERAATVARLPAVALGIMDPAEVPSGYALQLSLGPLDSLIDGMRLARDHKYALLLKMVQRLHQAGQHPAWTGLPVLPARIVFGPYTPTDMQSVLDQVAKGVEAGILSLETGMRMLTEAGFPIEDAATEIRNIQKRQFDKARLLADALGDPQAVAAYLGLPNPAAPQPPPPNLPPAPGTEPDPGTAATSANTSPGQDRGNTRE